jgi:threonine dehydratase/serine racemase
MPLVTKADSRQPRADSPPYAADLEAVRRAAGRIAPHAHRTPVMTCSTLDDLAGCRLFFKCELFQKTGSFKFRGACNAVTNLPDDQASRGVLTHSSGNHAQALALAAKLRGCQAHIVMPKTAPAIKRGAVEGYGGRVYLCEPTLAAREAVAAAVEQETGAVMIPSYDHADIIAGQGTAALELLETVSDIDAIIAPIGGGGLISGTCIAARALEPDIRVFAAEPSGADDAARSKAAGRLIPQTGPDTICDGLLTSLGELTWPVVHDLVEAVITAEDRQIIDAMHLTWQRAKLMIEPSAAVAVAVALSDAFKALDGLKRVGVILSGGNADLDRLPW